MKKQRWKGVKETAHGKKNKEGKKETINSEGKERSGKKEKEIKGEGNQDR
jgi:hypothetical protein